MRDLTKSAMSFSWAMSLYGASQLGKMLGLAGADRERPSAREDLEALSAKLVDQLGGEFRRSYDVGNSIQQDLVDALFGVAGGAPGSQTTSSPPIFSAQSEARESVVICHTTGTGQLSEDRRFIRLENEIVDHDGNPMGVHHGVWQALFESPRELLRTPPTPTGTLERPAGPVPDHAVSARTTARWAFGKSSMSSVGPAASHLIPLDDGSHLFLVITAQVVSGGTGQFAGARGISQSLGTTHIPAGSDLFSEGGVTSFPAATLDVFKIVGPEECHRCAATLQPSHIPESFELPRGGSGPGETVLTRYYRGLGRFSPDKRFINLQMTGYQPDGSPNGHMSGVWRAAFTDPRELLAVPGHPTSFELPSPALEDVPKRADTKGRWSFGDGSSVTAVGPAMTTLNSLGDGSFLFMVGTMQWITDGDGRWKGAQGLKSSLGSTYIPAGVDFFSPEIETFEATTIDTFRLMPGARISRSRPRR